MRYPDPERSLQPAGSRTRTLVGAAAALTLALAGVQVASPSADAITSVTTCVPRDTSVGWKAAVASAKTALSKAQTRMANGQYDRAAKQLRIMKRKTQVANTDATALIGKPPTDPESDDPPGVTAVLKVGGLDHLITTSLVTLFSDPHGIHVMAPLTKGLIQADACRDTMLDTVIALKPGKRDDYVDGLSDTLNSYPKELAAMADQLAGDGLTSEGRDALRSARAIVSETSAAMQSTFGGGERAARRS
jgi:hypothetical protein